MKVGRSRAVSIGCVVAALGLSWACSNDDPGGGGGDAGEAAQGQTGGDGGGDDGSDGGTPSTAGTGDGGTDSAGGTAQGGDAAHGGGAAHGGQPEATGAGGEAGAAPIATSLIDDFEDRDMWFAGVDRHFGWWFTEVDSYMTEIEPSPFEVSTLYCREASEGCAILNGQIPASTDSFFPWARFGGVFGSATNASQTKSYDASAYTGITFWAQGEAKIRFEVMMTEILDEAFGGTCDPLTVDGCNNGHKLSLELTPDWAQYWVPFDALAQDPDWGEPVAFDATDLYGFFLWFEEGTSFSAAFDDFAFY